jgi:hypothetical protein
LRFHTPAESTALKEVGYPITVMDDKKSAHKAKALIELCQNRQALIADRRRALERQRVLLSAQQEQLAIQKDWLASARGGRLVKAPG